MKVRLSLLLCLLFCTAAVARPVSITTLPLVETDDGAWRLPAGEYAGNFRIDTSMKFACEEGAIIDAGGKGHALAIAAPEVSVEGCTLVNWGRNLTNLDSAVFVLPTAHGAIVRNNTLRGPGFGVWVDTTRDVQVLENDITGVADVRSQDRGNGIHLYSVRGARVAGNRVRDVRDGIYVGNTTKSVLENNVLEGMRYGVHYMYSHDNRVSGNLTRHTRTGYALMQSRDLVVRGNRSEDDQNYGILMNFITYSELVDNVVRGVRQGSSGGVMIQGAEGKALFIYNSQGNRIERNRFEDSSLGIHLTAGSEGNQISSNAFINNQQQVKYVATRRQEWSVEERGNYWSDYLGWDRNGDGIGDLAYEPNDGVDRLLWIYPQARLLMNSPAIELLRWVQRIFPVMRSPGVQDSYPLMHPPGEAALASGKEARS